MTTDEAKDFVVKTCKSPLEIDVAAMGRGLTKRGFRVIEYERLTDADDVDRLQEFMVWIECDYGPGAVKDAITIWLEGLPDWPWPGHWIFVVKYPIQNQPRHEWTFEVVRFAGGGWSTRKTDAVPKWPDAYRRALFFEQAWPEII